MARILGGGVFGEMRGKMGSMVFARNRGGAYARAYVSGVDPATLAQLAARNNFGSAASNYHSLTPGIKSQWQEFANTVFNPKHGTTGVPSGYNAFVSLMNVVNNANGKGVGSYVGLTGTTNPFLFSGTPPTFALQTNFKNSTGGVNPYVFSDFGDLSISISGTDVVLSTGFSLIVQGASVGTTGNLSNFEDAVGNEFGFKVFMSNAVDQKGMFIANPEMIDLGYTPSLKPTAPAPIETTIAGTLSYTTSPGFFSALPIAGQIVQLTLYAVSTTGMLIRVGQSQVPVVDA